MTRAMRHVMPFALLLAAALPGAASAASVASQQDAGHTGFASGGSLDAPPLAQRWSRNLGTWVSHPLIAGGKVFVLATSASGGTKLYGLDARTGDTVWWRPVSSVSSDLAYDGGRIAVLEYGGLLTAVSAADGATRWARQVNDSYSSSRAVVADAGQVVVSGSSVQTFDLADGTPRWTAPMSYYDSGAPAADARNVYVGGGYCSGSAYNRQTGVRSWTSTSTCSSSYSNSFTVANGAWALFSSRLLDASTGLLRDNVVGGQPAVAGAIEVAVVGSELRARNAHTGVGVWTFDGDSYLSGLPLIVNNTVYVGSRVGKLFAVDLATGQQTWTTAIGDPVSYPSYYSSSDTQPGSTGMGAGDGLLALSRGGMLYALQSDIARPGLNVAISSGPDGPTSSATATFTYDADGAATRCRLDAGVWLPCAATSTYGPLADGPHTFEVRSEELGGAPIGLAARGFSVDTVAPTTSISSGPPALTNSTSASLRITTDGATMQCSLDDGAWTACPTSSYSYDNNVYLAALPDGEHVLRARGIDGVGNVESPGASYRWRVDTTAPSVIFDSVPQSSTSQSATVAFHASEGNATFSCAVDSYYVTSPCSSPFTVNGLGRGQHSFTISARDAAGNGGPYAYTYWTVEEPPPPPGTTTTTTTTSTTSTTTTTTTPPPPAAASEPTATQPRDTPTVTKVYSPTTTTTAAPNASTTAAPNASTTSGTATARAKPRSATSVTGDVARVLADTLGISHGVDVTAAPLPVFVIGPDEAGLMTVELLERSGRKRILAKGRTAVRPNAAALMTLRVNQTGKKVLPKSRKIKLTIRVTFRSTTGAVTTTSRRTRLK